MGKNTDILWCDHTFNSWWGCFKVSAGCTNCYAETFAKRIGHDIWGPPATTSRRLFGEKHWAEPLKWNAAAEREGVRKRVFCASMADVFEEHPLLPPEREKLWALIEQTPWLDWQLLTKRPENIRNMVPWEWITDPRPNVWYGTSVEDQPVARSRVPRLLAVPAAVHFLSCEPLLGPVHLGEWLYTGPLTETISAYGGMWYRRPRIDWVIGGGESGPRHRPLDLDWARSLRDQCITAGVPYFFKQVGGLHHAAGGRLLDGREWSEFPDTAARLVTP